MIVEAEHFVPGSGPGIAPAPAAFLRPDAALLFPRRAARLRVLAEGHEMGGYLLFVAGLVDRQAEAAGRAGGWAEILPHILAGVPVDALPPEAAEAVRALTAESPERWAERVGRLRVGEPLAEDLPYAPFLTAAVQAQLTRAAATAEPEPEPEPESEPESEDVEPGLCPRCGGHPVASTIGTEGQVPGLRRLHCGWCGTAWHLPRLCCSGCGAEGRLTYHRLEGYEPAVKAESCGACGITLKQFDLDAFPQVEPLADDMASLVLDRLLSAGENPPRRRAPNPFLLPD